MTLTLPWISFTLGFSVLLISEKHIKYAFSAFRYTAANLSLLTHGKRGRLERFLVCYLRSRSKSWHLTTPPLVSPRNDICATTAEIPDWISVTTHIWKVLLIGHGSERNFLQPIRSYTEMCVVTRHQYGILRSFLKRHFAGKSVADSRHVGFFLRLSSLSFLAFCGNYRLLRTLFYGLFIDCVAKVVIFC